MKPRTRKRLIAACIGIVLLSGIAAAYSIRSTMRDRAARVAGGEGMQAYQAGDYALAMAKLSTYVARNRDDADAILALADSRRRVPLENARHLVSALGFARAAAAAAADPVPALELVLDLCMQLGFKTEAREAADKILAHDPDHLRALMAKTYALAALGQAGPALEIARDAAARHPASIETHEAVVALLQQLQDTPGVRQYIDALVQSHPDQLRLALLECKTAATILRDQERASAAALRAATLTPADPEEFATILKYLRIFGHAEDFQRILDWGLTHPGLASEAHLIAADLRWKNGQAPDLHLAALPENLSSLPEHHLGMRAVITQLSAAQLGAIAEELNRRPSTSASPWANLASGAAALQTGKLDEAIGLLKQASDVAPTHGYAEYLLGQTTSRIGNWRSAADHFLAAASTDPMWRTARHAGVGILIENRQITRARAAALSAFRRTRQLGDALLYARASVAAIEAQQTSTEDASGIIAELEQMQQAHPDMAALLALRARALLASGRPQEAAALAEQILAASAEVPADGLAVLIYGLRREGLAVADRLDVLLHQLSGDSAAGITTRAATLLKSGQPEEAEAILRDALQHAQGPDATSLNLALVAVLDTRGDARAREILASLSDAHPANLDVQLAVLNSSSAWGDQGLISKALDRASEAIGRESDLWKQMEARRLLTFAPTEANAAKVIATLSDIARDDPANTTVAFLLSDAHLVLNDPSRTRSTEVVSGRDRAIEILTRAVNAVPEDVEISLRLIELLQQAGRSTEAGQRLTVLASTRGLSTAQLRRRVLLLTTQGMRAEATADLAALAAQGVPDDVAAYAQNRAEAGDMQTASRLFQSLLDRPDASDESLIAAVDFIASRDGLEAALQVLNRAPTASDQITRARAGLLERFDKRTEAEAILRARAQQQVPGAWADLGYFYFRGEEFPAALAAVEEGLKHAPDDTGLRWLQGAVNLRQKPSETASASELAAQIPLEALAPAARGVVQAHIAFEKHRDTEVFLRALEDLTRIYPNSVIAWREFVNLARSLGHTERALSAALAAATALPSDAHAAALAAESLARAGRWQEAAAFADRWRDLTPGDPTAADLMRAAIANRLKRYDVALRILLPQRARWEADQDSTPLANLAMALAGAGQEQEAEAILRPRAETDHNWLARYLETIEALLARPAAARAWLSSAPINEQAPASLQLAAAQYWLQLASATKTQADFEEAIRLSRMGATQLRGPAHALMGIAHAQLRQPSEAIAAYRIAAAEMPEDPGVLNNLAYLISTHQPSEEALTLATRAVSIAEQRKLPLAVRASFWDTLGTAALSLKRYREAADAFEKGLGLDSESLVMLIGLGEAQSALADHEALEATLLRIGAASAGAPPPPDLAARLERLRKTGG